MGGKNAENFRFAIHGFAAFGPHCVLQSAQPAPWCAGERKAENDGPEGQMECRRYKENGEESDGGVLRLPIIEQPP